MEHGRRRGNSWTGPDIASTSCAMKDVVVTVLVLGSFVSFVAPGWTKWYIYVCNLQYGFCGYDNNEYLYYHRHTPIRKKNHGLEMAPHPTHLAPRIGSLAPRIGSLAPQKDTLAPVKGPLAPTQSSSCSSSCSSSSASSSLHGVRRGFRCMYLTLAYRTS